MVTTTAGRTGVTIFTTPTDLATSSSHASSLNPKHVPNWLVGPDGWTMPVCEIDLRPGAAPRVSQGERRGDDALRNVSRVAPPERLVYTDSLSPEWPETVNKMILEVRRTDDDHDHRELSIEGSARRGARDGATSGMDQGFAKLDVLLRTMQ